MALDQRPPSQSDGTFSAGLEIAPDGLAECVLITFTGEIVASAFPAIFDGMRSVFPGQALNLISDYRAASFYANLTDSDDDFQRIEYTPDRNGTIRQIEDRSRNFGGILTLRLQGSF